VAAPGGSIALGDEGAGLAARDTFAADRTMKASSRRDFCGIKAGHIAYTSSLGLLIWDRSSGLSPRYNGEQPVHEDAHLLSGLAGCFQDQPGDFVGMRDQREMA
jgi:hypothetical protein